jgi:hypothetical protein
MPKLRPRTDRRFYRVPRRSVTFLLPPSGKYAFAPEMLDEQIVEDRAILVAIGPAILVDDPGESRVEAETVDASLS